MVRQTSNGRLVKPPPEVDFGRTLRTETTAGLPEGWSRREDDSGRVFYVNHHKRETQWEPPPGVYHVRLLPRSTTTVILSAAEDTEARAQPPILRPTTVMTSEHNAIAGPPPPRDDAGPPTYLSSVKARSVSRVDASGDTTPAKGSSSFMGSALSSAAKFGLGYKKRVQTNTEIGEDMRDRVKQEAAEERRGKNKIQISSGPWATVNVRIGDGANLPMRDMKTPINAVIKLHIEHTQGEPIEEQQTETKWGEKDTVWGEDFSMITFNPESTIVISIYDQAESLALKGVIRIPVVDALNGMDKFFSFTETGYVDNSMGMLGRVACKISVDTDVFNMGDGNAHDAALPPGWESRVTEEGRLFFVDNRRGTTQWGHPLANDIATDGWARTTDAKGRTCYMEMSGRQQADGRTEYRRVYYNPGDPLAVQRSRDEVVKMIQGTSEVMAVPLSDTNLRPQKMREVQDIVWDRHMDNSRLEAMEGKETWGDRFMSFFVQKHLVQWPHGTCKLSDRKTLRRCLNKHLVLLEPWRTPRTSLREHHVLHTEMPTLEGELFLREQTPERQGRWDEVYCELRLSQTDPGKYELAWGELDPLFGQPPHQQVFPKVLPPYWRGVRTSFVEGARVLEVGVSDEDVRQISLQCPLSAPSRGTPYYGLSFVAKRLGKSTPVSLTLATTNFETYRQWAHKLASPPQLEDTLRAPLSPYNMACAGLFYMPSATKSDRVACLECGFAFDGFKTTDDPATTDDPQSMHKNMSPDCRSALGISPRLEELPEEVRMGVLGGVEKMYQKAGHCVGKGIGPNGALGEQQKEAVDIGLVLELRHGGVFVKRVVEKGLAANAQAADRHDQGALGGKVLPGDELVGIEGEDVLGSGQEVRRLMIKHSDRLTEAGRHLPGMKLQLRRYGEDLEVLIPNPNPPRTPREDENWVKFTRLPSGDFAKTAMAKVQSGTWRKDSCVHPSADEVARSRKTSMRPSRTRRDSGCFVENDAAHTQLPQAERASPEPVTTDEEERGSAGAQGEAPAMRSGSSEGLLGTIQKSRSIRFAGQEEEDDTSNLGDDGNSTVGGISALARHRQQVAQATEGLGDRLLQCALNGDIVGTDQCLRHGAPINHADGGLRTALHWAATFGHYDVLKLLLIRGADVNARTSLGYSAQRLARNGKYHLCESALRAAGSTDGPATLEEEILNMV